MNVIYWIVNIAGALALLPILLVSAFGFDQPGTELFAALLFITNLAYPTLAIAALCMPARRHAGLLGLLITVVCWNLIGFACEASRACR